MAGATERQEPDAKHYVDYEEYVDFQLEKTRSNIKRTDILTTLTTLAVVLVAYLLVFVVFDQWVIEGGFGYAARVVSLCVLASVVLATVSWRVLWPLLRRVHPLYAARVIEQSDPNLKSNLVNFVDVREANAESAPVVLKAMQKRAAVELSHIDVEEAVDHRPLLRIAYALLAVVVVSALYIIFSPKDPFASVRRALLPTAAIEVATETTISDVSPGDKDVPARTILTIEADVRGKDADHVQILYSTADHKYVDQPVEMRRIDENLPRYRGVLNGENGRGLLQNLTYRLIAGDARTKDFAINVIQPPGARVDDVHYVFPSYMQFEAKTTQGGHIDGWEGATVTVRATTNLPVKRATIILTDTEDNTATGKEEIAMQVADGTKLSASWKLDIREDGSAPHYYHIQVKTENGETDPDPTQYTLRIRPDQRPEVALLAPTGDFNAPANGIIPLVIQAVDPDFLLRSITLKAENRGEALRDQKLFGESLDVQSFRGKHDFKLEPLGLKAGDVLRFWIEAKDNKQPTANRGATPVIQVTIGKPVSAQEVNDELAREKQKQQDQIARADDAANRDKAGEQTPPQPGKEDETDKNDRRPQPPAPGEERPKNEKQEKDDDAASLPRDDQKEDQKLQKPDRDDFQQQLQKLMQKEQEKKAGDKNQDEQQQDQESQPPQEKGDRGKDKQNQKSADGSKGKSQKNDSAGQKSKGSDGDQRQPNSRDGEQEKSGGQGKSNDRKDQTSKSQNERSNDREKPGPAKSKPNQDQTNPGDEGSDKSDDASKPGKGKSSKDGDRPGDQSEDQKKNDGGKNDSPTKDGASKDDSSDKDGQQKSKDGSSKPDKPAADPNKSGSDDQTGTEQKNQKQGGAGKDQADQSDPASNSKDPSKGKGSPSKSDQPEGDQQPGEGDGEKSKKTGDGAAKPGKDAGETGEEKPADESPDAVKKKATGDETGEATGDEKGDPQAPKAKNPLDKKPGSKPGAKNPSADSDPDAKKSAQQRKSEDGTKNGSDDPGNAKRAPDGKKDTEQPGQIDDPASEPRPDLKKDPADEKRPGKPPEGGNQPLKGEGRKEGQKADNADTGEQGSSTATDQGKPGGNKEGGGDKSDEPGDTDPSGKKTGQPGKKKGDGSTTRPTDKEGTKENGPGEESGNKPSSKGDKSKPGDKSGESPNGKSSDKNSAGNEDCDKPGDGKGPTRDGKPGEKQGEQGEQGGKGADGKSNSKPGSGKPDGQSSQPGKPGKTGTQKSGGGADLPSGGKGDEPSDGGNGPSDADGPKPRENADDDEPPPPQDEEARLDFARNASNLVLQRLKGQLERGEVDQELLDELGWKNKADMERFVKMLEQGLKDSNDDNSPEAVARRLQFEEMLKSMKLGNETTRRKGGAGASRAIQQIGDRKVPVPPEYQKLVESYTRSLSKQVEKPAGDKAAADKTKKPAGK